MLKSEFIKFAKSKFLLLVTVLMIIGAFFFTTREGAMRYGLFTSTDMYQYIESTLADHHRASLLVAMFWGLDSGWVESNSTNSVDIVKTVHEVQYNRLLNTSLGFVILAVFFAPYYIGMDFKSRLWNNMLYVGRTRGAIFRSRIIAYFVIVVIVSVLTTLGLILLYAGTVFEKVSAGAVWLGILKKIVYDAAFMSVPLVFVYLFKGAVYPAICTLVVNLTLWGSLLAYGKPNDSAGVSISAVITPMKLDFLPSFDMTEIPIFVPALLIVVCVVVAWRFFKRANLY